MRTLAWAAATAAILIAFFASPGWGLPVTVPIATTVGVLLAMAVAGAKAGSAAARFANGAAVALAAGLVLLLLRFSLLIGFGALMGDVLTPALLILALVVQVAYLRTAVRTVVITDKMSLAGLLSVPLIGAIAVGAMGVTRQQQAERKATGWAATRDSIYRVAACAIRARGHDGTFPATLPSACGVDSTASSSTLRFSYRTALDSAGIARGFVLRAESQEHRQGREVYVDTAGLLLRYLPSSPIDPVSDIVIDEGVTALRSLAACLSMRRGMTAAQAIDVADRPLECASVSWKGDTMTASPDGALLSSRGYRYSVTWIDTASARFVIEARPQRYGITAIRSFRFLSRDSIRSTAENRAATDSDRASKP